MYLVKPDSGRIFLSKDEGITRGMKIIDLKKLLAAKCGKSDYTKCFFMYQREITEEENNLTIADICNYRMTTVHVLYKVVGGDYTILVRMNNGENVTIKISNNKRIE